MFNDTSRSLNCNKISILARVWSGTYALHICYVVSNHLACDCEGLKIVQLYMNNACLA
jgi:hypothetical protein